MYYQVGNTNSIVGLAALYHDNLQNNYFLNDTNILVLAVALSSVVHFSACASSAIFHAYSSTSLHKTWSRTFWCL